MPIFLLRSFLNRQSDNLPFPDCDMWPQFFQCLWTDAGDAAQVVDGFEGGLGARIEDSLRQLRADAGELLQVCLRSLIDVDRLRQLACLFAGGGSARRWLGAAWHAHGFYLVASCER